MKCGKCGGKGNLKEYGHIAGGVCFECNGSGVDNGIAKGKKSYEVWAVDGRHFDYMFSYDSLQTAINRAMYEYIRFNGTEYHTEDMEITKTRKSGDSGRTVWEL